MKPNEEKAGAKQGPAREAQSAAAADTVLGDRGILSVNRGHSLQTRLGNMLAISFMVALGAGLLTWYYAQAFSRQARGQQKARTTVSRQAASEMPLPSLGTIDPPSAPSAPDPALMRRVLGAPPPPPPVIVSAGQSFVTPAASHARRGSPVARSLARRLAGPAFASTSTAQPVTEASTGASAPEGREPVPLGGAPAAAGEGNAAGALAHWLTPSLTPTVAARVLPDRDLVLPKGTFIDCTLETAIDSSLPGLVTCVTATDTFGADGRVVLLERGTKLVGETRGVVQQGMARVFVLWTEARTPSGVVVPLDSPGTDELGRSGLPGSVNRHFFQRFGAALLISVIDGAVQAGIAAQSQGGAVIYNPGGGEGVMTDVLKGTVDIPPTVVKHNGDRIQVLVARDLDFRSVYELRAVGSH